LSNVVCALLIYKNPLWSYQSQILNCTFCDLFVCITAYPSTVMLFIHNLPKKTIKIISNISFYVAIYTIAEFIGFRLGYFAYYNWWDIWHSLIFNYV